MTSEAWNLPTDTSETQRPTVFIVDEDVATRSNVSELVRSAGFGFQSYESASQFLESYEIPRPGCLVLEVRLHDMDGLELQQELKRRGRSLPIIFVTGHGDVPVIARAIRQGAVDVLAKPIDPAILLSRIQEAIQFDAVNLVQEAQVAELQQCLGSLTDREREVMQYLAAGDSAKEIAHKLGVTAKTIDNHRTKILDKMKVDNPTQLARKIALLQTQILPSELSRPRG